MRTIAERKRAAKANLGNGIFSANWMSGVLVNLVLWGITGAVGSFSLGILSVIVLGPIACGVNACYLKNARDKQKMDVANMFAPFNVDFGGTVLLGLLTDVFVALWSLLFVIPGIVKAYAYSMSYYIKADHPEYDWRQCMDESQRLMKGHKGELFIQDLSFIGWSFIGALCAGVGFLWVNAYADATKAEFYQDLIGASIATNVE